jgi:protoheme IX farnesyltransferase
VKAAVIDSEVVDAPDDAVSSARRRALADFAELVKARLTFLVLVTTAVGFDLGLRSAMDYRALFHVVFGTALAAAGAAALNQWWERAFDALMLRTRMRPIPAGRMLPRDGIAIGIVLAAAGVAYLAVACNFLSAALAAVTVVVYIFAYTPLKRVSTVNTFVGAIPGALPPLIGWAAASHALPLPAWSLFGIMFFWQLPHFFAISWMYRDDYARGGFVMLSAADASGARTARQSIFFMLLLVAASLAPFFCGIVGRAYLLPALLLGGGFLAMVLRFRATKDVPAARRMFFASIIYLPLLLLALMLTKV